MLTDAKLMAFVPTLDFEKARAFYRDTLGLSLIDENPFALVFAAGGRTLRVTKVPGFEPLPFTLVGWDVGDIKAAIKDLRGRGVTFLVFDGMPQDDDGIWSAPDGAQVAWFKDPDGNTLSVTQVPS